MNWGELSLFALTMGLAQMSVGPDMILLTRTALSSGRPVGLAMAFGIACGLCVHALLVLSGLSRLVLLDKRVMGAFLLLGAGYLGYLGVLLLRSAWKVGEVMMERAAGEEMGLLTAWRRGLMCNLLNPKAALAISAMTLPFLDAGSGSAWSAALFSVIVLQAWVLWTLWVCVLQVEQVRVVYARLARWMDGVFGGCLLGLAGWLLFSRSAD